MCQDMGLWGLGATATGGLIAVMGVFTGAIFSSITQMVISQKRNVHEENLTVREMKLKKSETIFKMRLNALDALSEILSDVEPRITTPYLDDPESEFEGYSSAELEKHRNSLTEFLRSYRGYIPKAVSDGLWPAIEAANDGVYEAPGIEPVGACALKCYRLIAKSYDSLAIQVQAEAASD